MVKGDDLLSQAIKDVTTPRVPLCPSSNVSGPLSYRSKPLLLLIGLRHDWIQKAWLWTGRDV